jgi:hypothetical protein
VSVGVDVTEDVCVEEAVAVRVLTLESLGYLDALMAAEGVEYVDALIAAEGVGYVDALISVEGVGYVEALIAVEDVAYVEALINVVDERYAPINGSGVIEATGDVVIVINVVIDAS